MSVVQLPLFLLSEDSWFVSTFNHFMFVHFYKSPILLVQLLERTAYFMFTHSFILYLIADSTQSGGGWCVKDAIAFKSFYFGLIHFFALFGGWLTDRVLGHKRAIVLGLLCSVIGYFSLGHALVYSHPFLLGLMAIACGYAFFKPASSSLLGYCYSSSQNQREKGFSLAYTIHLTGCLIGSFLAGYMKKYCSFPFILYQGGVFFCLALLLSFCLRSAHSAEREKRKTTLQCNPDFEIYQSIRIIGALLCFAILHYGSHILCRPLVNAYLERHVDRSLRGWEIPTPWFDTMQILLQITMALCLPWLRSRKLDNENDLTRSIKRLSLGALASACAFICLILPTYPLSQNAHYIQSLSSFAPYYFAFLIFFLFSNICVNPILWATVFALAPGRYKSFVLSWLLLAMSIGGFLPSFLVFMKELHVHLTFGVLSGVAFILAFGLVALPKLNVFFIKRNH